MRRPARIASRRSSVGARSLPGWHRSEEGGTLRTPSRLYFEWGRARRQLSPARSWRRRACSHLHHESRFDFTLGFCALDQCQTCIHGNLGNSAVRQPSRRVNKGALGCAESILQSRYESKEHYRLVVFPGSNGAADDKALSAMEEAVCPQSRRRSWSLRRSTLPRSYVNRATVGSDASWKYNSLRGTGSSERR
jgi:hypothetical protein